MDIGVIGVGVMGKNHARIYSELKSVDSIRVYDAQKTVSETVANTFGCIACNTLDQIISECDAVSICVPTRLHAEIIMKAIKADVDMLIEKPLCSGYEESRRVVKELAYSRVVAGVGHIERFNPVIPELRKVIADPLYIEMKRHNPASSRNPDTSIVDDLMIHDIDILLHVFNAHPTNINGIGNKDVCNVGMIYNGVPVSLSASRKASKKFREIYIEEEQVTIEADLISQEITVYHKPEKHLSQSGKYISESTIEKVFVNKVEPLRAELMEFIRCVKDNKPFPITPLQASENIRLCEDIKTSLVI